MWKPGAAPRLFIETTKTGVRRVFNDQDQQFMRLALDLARTARAEGEVPVGAVLVVDGSILGRGHNGSVAQVDPTAHAEIVAVRAAATRLGNYRLVGSTLYCTVEPCLMCLGTLLHARVRRLVFGAYENRVGATGRLEELRNLGADINHRIDTVGGVLADEASELLLEFFREKRAGASNVLRASGEVPKWS